MSSLMRWSSGRDIMTMREMMDRLFNEAFVMPRQMDMNMPNVDVIENDNDVIVKAELPGFKPEDVDVQVEGNILSLRGEYDENNENQEGEYRVRETRRGSFNRLIQLPTDVNTEACSADFENGILTLTLPKQEEAKPKRINIQNKTINATAQSGDGARQQGQTGSAEAQNRPQNPEAEGTNNQAKVS